MKFRQFVFRQFLEDEETIDRAFRGPFPFSKILLYTGITFGAALFIRWLFFCSHDAAFCPYQSEGEYAYIAVVIIGLYKTIQVFLSWYGNAVLMTTESLLFVTWPKLFSPTSVRLDYWDLDAVEVVRSGASSYIRNVGNLSFSKISGGEAIVFEKVYRPHRTEKIITANRERMVDEKNFTEQSALKDLLAGLVDSHVRENGQPDGLREKAKQVLSRKNNEPTSPKEPKPKKRKHFENEIEEVEKKLDDTGGIEIDL